MGVQRRRDRGREEGSALEGRGERDVICDLVVVVLVHRVCSFYIAMRQSDVDIDVGVVVVIMLYGIDTW